MPLKSDLRRYTLDNRPCEICGGINWVPWHWDEITDGKYPTMALGVCAISLCTKCGVGRLHQSIQKTTAHYTTGEYQKDRENPGQNRLDPLMGREICDKSFPTYFEMLKPETLRNKVICDVGCAGGGFVDHFANVAKEIVVVEPCVAYTNSLRQRGYHTYFYAEDAIKDWAGKIDYLLAFELIEHLPNPLNLLDECKQLLHPSGEMLLTTPNFNYLLADIFEEVRPIYYQTAHTWYFDTSSLRYCIDKVGGFEIKELKTNQRESFAHVLYTIFGAEKSNKVLRLMLLDDEDLNYAFKRFLEKKGWAHYLYAKLKLK